MQHSSDWSAAATEIWQKAKKLQLGMGAEALRHVRNGMQREHRLLQGQDELALRALGGRLPGGGDEMDNLILGDVNVASPPAAANQFGKLAGAALLAASVMAPASWLGAKYLDRPAVEQPPAEVAPPLVEWRIVRD